MRQPPVNVEGFSVGQMQDMQAAQLLLDKVDGLTRGRVPSQASVEAQFADADPDDLVRVDAEEAAAGQFGTLFLSGESPDGEERRVVLVRRFGNLQAAPLGRWLGRFVFDRDYAAFASLPVVRTGLLKVTTGGREEFYRTFRVQDARVPSIINNLGLVVLIHRTEDGQEVWPPRGRVDSRQALVNTAGSTALSELIDSLHDAEG